MAEKEGVKGYILADKIFAWKPNVHYALLFTSDRMIVAKVGGQLTIDLGAFAKKAEELKEVSLESILKADKNNFEIPYSDIVNIEIKKSGWKDKIVANRLVPGVITVKGKEEHKFVIAQIKAEASKFKPQKFQECVDLLRSILPSKLSVKD